MRIGRRSVGASPGAGRWVLGLVNKTKSHLGGASVPMPRNGAGAVPKPKNGARSVPPSWKGGVGPMEPPLSPGNPGRRARSEPLERPSLPGFPGVLGVWGAPCFPGSSGKPCSWLLERPQLVPGRLNEPDSPACPGPIFQFPGGLSRTGRRTILGSNRV